jgi:hypothetical protein
VPLLMNEIVALGPQMAIVAPDHYQRSEVQCTTLVWVPLGTCCFTPARAATSRRRSTTEELF